MKKKIWKKRMREVIQIIFFLWMPALYTSAFSGIKYVVEQIRGGNPIEENAFLTTLIILCFLTIVFGRFFCGFVCAFGTLGDGIYAISEKMQKKFKKKIPWFSMEVSTKLQRIKYILLISLVFIYGFGVSHKFQGTSPWEVFSMLYTGKIPGITYIIAWILFVLIIIGMGIKERFFCQYLCPMGAVFAWLPILPLFTLKREKEHCIPKCRACQLKCPVDLKLQKDQKNGGECIKCLACMDTCPKSNIHIISKFKKEEL